MTIDQIRAICEADRQGFRCIEFVAAARDLMPKLLAVAEAAEALFDDAGMGAVHSAPLAAALAALEAP